MFHFATTAHFNKANPLFSRLDLAKTDRDDGHLEVHEIFSLDLNARMVTLSACKTALGSGYAATFPQGDDFVGLTRAFIPLHRGSDGFMSLPQFEKFYWPQLKEMIVTLVDNGIYVVPYYEGVWDKRLEYLTELPKGKTGGMFQSSDIFKVKEVVGDTMCIIGGMKNSLLQSGSVAQVREFTQKLCEEVGKGGGFIMSTEVGELEDCNPELIAAWMDATREFGVY